MKKYSLPKKMIVKSNEQFRQILARKFFKYNGLLIVYIAENNLDYPRLAATVSGKSGSAVKRNRFKRLIRETFRLERENISAGFDYLVLPRMRLSEMKEKELSFECVRSSFSKLATELVIRFKKTS